MSAPIFTQDVFLSHRAKDKAVVRPLAERLRQDGLKVWFDEWEMPKAEGRGKKEEVQTHPSSFLLHPTDEAGLKRSRFVFRASDFGFTQPGPFRFRDPLNQERRFIPLRLDNAPTKATLAQFLFGNPRTYAADHNRAKLAGSLDAPEARSRNALVLKTKNAAKTDSMEITSCP